MRIVDVVIILMIALGAVIGFKRGFFRQTVSSVGLVFVIILSFTWKNAISGFMYEKLPFFSFDGIFAGVSALNILVYELIAFLIMFALLSIVLKIIMWIAGLIEKALNFTILLGIPSKILGALIGLIEGYVIVFIVLYILTLPVFSIGIVNDSKLKGKILSNTPIVSKYADDTVTTFNEIYALREEYKKDTDSDELNKKVLTVLLKNDIVTVNGVEKLVESKKLNIKGIDDILDRYR